MEMKVKVHQLKHRQSFQPIRTTNTAAWEEANNKRAKDRLITNKVF